MLMEHIAEAIRDQTVQMMQEHPNELRKSPREIFKLVFQDYPIQPTDAEEKWCLNHILENRDEAIKVIAAAMGMM